MILFDGTATAATIKEEIAQRVRQILADGGRRPHLAAILVGHDGGSETYVANKVKACEVCGFQSTLIRYEADVTEQELIDKVIELNNDDSIDGFIVQLPLPRHIDEQKIKFIIDLSLEYENLLYEIYLIIQRKVNIMGVNWINSKFM